MFIIDRDIANRADLLLAEYDQANGRARMKLDPELPQQVHDFGSGVVVFYENHLDRSRATRFGMQGPVSPETIDKVESLYASKGASPLFAVNPYGDPAFGEELGRRGYSLTIWMQVMVRKLDDIPGMQPPETLRIDDLQTDEHTVWAETIASGFAGFEIPYVRDPAIHLVTPQVDGIHCYLARWKQEIAAAACLFVSRSWAFLFIASTRESFRRKGIQTALIHHRLLHAHQLGCSHAVIVVMPGSESNRNAARAGFQIAYSRPLLKQVEQIRA